MRELANLLWAALSVAWLTMLLIEVARRNHAGRVLFDLGGSPNQDMRTGMGVLLLLLGVAFILLPRLNIYQGIGHILWGLYYLLIATRRVQLREAGILARHKLIRWRDLLGFSLEPDGILRFRMQTPEGKIIGCKIPAADQETVAHIVSLRLPLLPTS